MPPKQRSKKLNPKYAKVWILEAPNEYEFNDVCKFRRYLDWKGFKVRHIEERVREKYRVIFQIYFWHYQRLKDLQSMGDVLWMTNKVWNNTRRNEFIPQAKHVQTRLNYLADQALYEAEYDKYTLNDLLEIEAELLRIHNEKKKEDALRERGYFIFKD